MDLKWINNMINRGMRLLNYQKDDVKEGFGPKAQSMVKLILLVICLIILGIGGLYLIAELGWF